MASRENMMGRRPAAHVGLMLSIFSPDLDLTNSLLMKRPMGCSYLRPLGAVRVTVRSDIVRYQSTLNFEVE